MQLILSADSYGQQGGWADLSGFVGRGGAECALQTVRSGSLAVSSWVFDLSALEGTLGLPGVPFPLTSLAHFCHGMPW